MSRTWERTLSSETPAITGPVAVRLRRDNAIATLVHLLQAASVLALASSFAPPVTAAYLQGPPGTPCHGFRGAVRHPDRRRGCQLLGAIGSGAPPGVHSLAAPLVRRPSSTPQPSPVGEVLGLVLADDRVHRPARRHRRRGRTPCVVRCQRLHDPVRLAAGALRGARCRRLVAVLLRVSGRGRAVACHRGLPAVPGLDVLGGPAKIRVRHLRVAVRLLQCLCTEPVAAVPRPRPLVRLPLRRTHPYPVCLLRQGAPPAVARALDPTCWSDPPDTKLSGQLAPSCTRTCSSDAVTFAVRLQAPAPLPDRQ